MLQWWQIPGGRYRAADGVNAGVNTSVIVGVMADERWSVSVFWALNGAE